MQDLCMQYLIKDETSELDNEVDKKLERMKLGRYADTERKIPKIVKKPLFQATKKNADLCNRKIKKPISKNISLQDSFLNIDEQIKTNQNILELQDKLGVTIVQKNGQRKLGGPPPGWTGPPPGPGCEVFVGRIPRNVYEDVIYPIFRQMGNIYEMRLMMNFSGTNRGYCFIMYERPEFAQKAIKELNNYQIHPGWSIGVVKSVNNCRLHVTDLPSQVDTKSLIKKIWPVCEDIEKVSVFTSLRAAHLKHALISFKTHRSAAMARRKLLPERNKFFDKSEVRIEWAHPKISITNVIEESGFCEDDDGEVIISKKIIGSDNKTFDDDFNNDKKGVKIIRKKQIMQNFPKKRHSETVKNIHNEFHRFPKDTSRKSVSVDNDDNYVQPYNRDNSINHSDYEQEFYCNENFNNNSLQSFDKFKYSSRSDESLSEFSKNSDSDDCKSGSFCESNNNYNYNYVLSILNPTNCSVVHYPWNTQYQLPKQSLNINYQNNNFHTIPFPWRISKYNRNIESLQISTKPNLNYQYFNCEVLQFINNYKLNNAGDVRLYPESKSARPILNRNLSY